MLSAVNNITPHIAGAVDIMVVEQPDGSRKATPFYGAPGLAGGLPCLRSLSAFASSTNNHAYPAAYLRCVVFRPQFVSASTRPCARESGTSRFTLTVRRVLTLPSRAGTYRCPLSLAWYCD